MFNMTGPNRQFSRLGPNNDAVYSVSGIGDTRAMTTKFDALAAISAAPPALGTESVANAIETQFGLAGEFSPLVSERDQNFLLRTGDGKQYVTKVTSAHEDPAATDFQIGALLHLEKAQGLLVPRVCRTREGRPSGELLHNDTRHRLRVVSWVGGAPLEDRVPDTASVRAFGAALARLDAALCSYSHPGASPVLLWDLQRTPELRGLTANIDDASVRRGVVRAIADYEDGVVPVLADLRSQVIHGDANPGNVLIADAGIGFIDFGDMTRAPLIFDVAIACAYLRSFGDDPLEYIVPFIEAYHSVTQLENEEADLLFDLVRARLAATVTLLYWRLAERAENDPYREKTLEKESGAERFLARLDSLGRAGFRQKLACCQ